MEIPDNHGPDRQLPPAPLLIALARGMVVSGITTWAVRTAGALCAAGRPAGLIVHRPAAGHEPLSPVLHPRVRVFDCTDLPDLGECAGDLSAFIPAYAHAVKTMAADARRPVVLSPNHLGDCYGIGAALCLAEPGVVRLVGYQHLMIPYDTRVLAHYEPVIARFVGVSDAIAGALRAALPQRASDVRNIPYGVALPVRPGVHSPGRSQDAGGPLRLIYTGRLEHGQKRVGALLELSRALSRRGIDHRLTLVGDGPAAPEVRAAASRAGEGKVVVKAAVGPDEVPALLEAHDVFVLASRVEGLSVSMLEAMARGCVPVVTRGPSGTEQALTTGTNGVIVDAPQEADDRSVGAALSAGVERALALGLPRLSAGARDTIARRFSLEHSAALTARAIDECAAAPARTWPAQRAVAFSGGAGGPGSGSVPPDGAARLRDALQRLAGRSILVHGTGRHTVELAEVFADSPARIVAFTDDDPQRQGGTISSWPVLAPADGARSGATDVLISSWINQGAIWERRSVYEERGLVVHRLYADD